MSRTMYLHHGIPGHRGSGTTYRAVDPKMVRWIYRLLRDGGLTASTARMVMIVTGNTIQPVPAEVVH